MGVHFYCVHGRVDDPFQFYLIAEMLTTIKLVLIDRLFNQHRRIQMDAPMLKGGIQAI